MGNIDGVYYLHENGDLIYKPGTGCIADIRDSSFSRAIWPVDPSNREHAWNVLVEGLATGATPSRVNELASKWSCNDIDAIEYAERVGCLLGVDGDQKTASRLDFINLQESPCGFGSTYLEAMADLAKQLGYIPSKTWGKTFKSLLEKVV